MRTVTGQAWYPVRSWCSGAQCMTRSRALLTAAFAGEEENRMHAKFLRCSARHIACRKHLLRTLAKKAARSMPQLCVAKLDGLARRVPECNVVAGRDTFVPWSADGAIGGYLRPEFAQLLAEQHSDVFKGYYDVEGTGSTTPTEVHFAKRGLAEPERTRLLAGVTAALRDAGHVRGWRGELYPVLGSFGQPPLCLVERAAAAHFGIKAYGVHINGFVETAAGLELWVARRSKDKPTWPGKLDHIVAGGQTSPQSHGISPADNVVKECGEEAGIPADIARTAMPVGAVSYETVTADGLKRDVLFCYDLKLPADFQPTAQDGEVDEFTRLPIEEVADVISSTTDFKPNCAVVIIDFLVRHGCVSPEQPGYLQLVASLRQGDCS